jgi:hypothetical protein
MQDIAANDDHKTFEALLVAPDRQRVQQSLGWVFVLTIPGVYNCARNLLC